MKQIIRIACLFGLSMSSFTINATVVIDVLVVLSQDYVIKYQTETLARGEAASLISQANTIYANSSGNVSLRMIAVVRIPDVSDLFIEEQLMELETSQTVQDARYRYGADLVTLLASDGWIDDLPDPTKFGISSGPPSSSEIGNLEYASYSVTRAFNFSYDRFTYAHEAGHSMGLAHNVSSDEWENYSHGYSISSSGQNRHTCVASPAGHIASDHRLARLSNPSILYLENPYFYLVPLGTSLNDNARTLRDSGEHIDDIDDPFVFYSSSILDGEYRYYSWWGYFETGSFPWVWHDDLEEWIFVDEAQSPSINSMMLWKETTNWFWAQGTTGPILEKWPDVWHYGTSSWCNIESTCP